MQLIVHRCTNIYLFSSYKESTASCVYFSSINDRKCFYSSYISNFHKDINEKKKKNSHTVDFRPLIYKWYICRVIFVLQKISPQVYFQVHRARCCRYSRNKDDRKGVKKKGGGMREKEMRSIQNESTFIPRLVENHLIAFYKHFSTKSL